MNLLRGKHLTPEGTVGFYEICRELHDFTGALRLSGKVKGDFCQADLLVDAGYIVAVSFEDLEKREILLREAALDEIRTNFVKSVGSLDISELKKDELKTALDENETALLDSLIPLTILGMKIKPIEKTTVKEPKKKRHWLFGLGGKGKEKKKKEDIVRTELPKKKFKSGVGAQSPSNVAAIMGSGGKTAGAANANTKAGTGQGGHDLAGLMGALGKGKKERIPSLLICRISPGAISRMYSASIRSNTQDSEATTQAPLIFPRHKGRNPCGSRAARISFSDIRIKE